MRLKPLFLITVAILITAALSAQAPRTPASPEPPKTAVSDVKENLHGVEITDPYRWLEDQNSPETRKWIDAENEYTDSLLNNIPGQDALDKKVAALLKIETMNTPVVRGGRYFLHAACRTRTRALSLSVVASPEKTNWWLIPKNWIQPTPPAWF